MFVAGALCLSGVAVNQNADAHVSVSTIESELAAKDGGANDLAAKDGGVVELATKEAGVDLAAKDGGCGRSTLWRPKKLASSWQPKTAA